MRQVVKFEFGFTFLNLSVSSLHIAKSSRAELQIPVECCLDSPALRCSLRQTIAVVRFCAQKGLRPDLTEVVWHCKKLAFATRQTSGIAY